MDILAAFMHGLNVAFMPENLFYCFVGVFLGTLIGVLPGIGSLAAVSMLMPLSFYLEPTTAIIMLAGVYYGAEYGGSTASILLNLPGTPSSAITCLEGYPMARSGRAGVALFTTTISSFVGGTLGIIGLMIFAPVLSQFALAFGPAEYFGIMILGLFAAVAISQGSMLKGLAMVVLGILLGIVGSDPNLAVARFTFGQTNLLDGINLVPVAMGLFGISEVIASVNRSHSTERLQKVSLRSMIPTRDDFKRSGGPTMRGGILGMFFGALPGTGATIASFASYALERRMTKTPERFGKGAIEGVAGPEAANNAAAQSAFIPTLTLGVPGSATMAIMLGALMIHGILPGPRMMTQYPDVFWGLVASFLVGNIMLLVLNIPFINLWVRVLQVPYHLLYPAIIVLICIGVFSIRNSMFDVGLALGFGALGYGMRLLQYEPAPLLMGFVLGPMMEANLRRALTLSRGDPGILVASPVSMTILVTLVLLVVWVFYTTWRNYRRRAAA